MYDFVDHIICKHCAQTNCLFKLRVDAYQKKKTGNISYKVTSECKACYLERCRIKNERHYGDIYNRIKINKRARAVRTGNPHYINAARKSYWKHRVKILEKKRDKYIKIDPKKDKRRTFSLIGKIREGVW